MQGGGGPAQQDQQGRGGAWAGGREGQWDDPGYPELNNNNNNNNAGREGPMQQRQGGGGPGNRADVQDLHQAALGLGLAGTSSQKRAGPASTAARPAAAAQPRPPWVPPPPGSQGNPNSASWNNVARKAPSLMSGGGGGGGGAENRNSDDVHHPGIGPQRSRVGETVRHHGQQLQDFPGQPLQTRGGSVSSNPTATDAQQQLQRNPGPSAEPGVQRRLQRCCGGNNNNNTRPAGSYNVQSSAGKHGPVYSQYSNQQQGGQPGEFSDLSSQQQQQQQGQMQQQLKRLMPSLHSQQQPMQQQMRVSSGSMQQQSQQPPFLQQNQQQLGGDNSPLVQGGGGGQDSATEVKMLLEIIQRGGGGGPPGSSQQQQAMGMLQALAQLASGPLPDQAQKSGVQQQEPGQGGEQLVGAGSAPWLYQPENSGITSSMLTGNTGGGAGGGMNSMRQDGQMGSWGGRPQQEAVSANDIIQHLQQQQLAPQQWGQGQMPSGQDPWARSGQRTSAGGEMLRTSNDGDPVGQQGYDNMRWQQQQQQQGYPQQQPTQQLYMQQQPGYDRVDGNPQQQQHHNIGQHPSVMNNNNNNTPSSAATVSAAVSLLTQSGSAPQEEECLSAGANPSMAQPPLPHRAIKKEGRGVAGAAAKDGGGGVPGDSDGGVRQDDAGNSSAAVDTATDQVAALEAVGSSCGGLLLGGGGVLGAAVRALSGLARAAEGAKDVVEDGGLAAADGRVDPAAPQHGQQQQQQEHLQAEVLPPLAGWASVAAAAEGSVVHEPTPDPMMHQQLTSASCQSTFTATNDVGKQTAAGAGASPHV
ncbi:MAG: hypothetical protein WDW36_001488 [Sanguina aurantia]